MSRFKGCIPSINPDSSLSIHRLDACGSLLRLLFLLNISKIEDENRIIESNMHVMFAFKPLETE